MQGPFPFADFHPINRSANLSSRDAAAERSQALMEKAAGALWEWVSDSACAPLATIQREPHPQYARGTNGWMDAHAWLALPDLNGHVKGWRRHIYLWIRSANSSEFAVGSVSLSVSATLRARDREEDECGGDCGCENKIMLLVRRAANRTTRYCFLAPGFEVIFCAYWKFARWAGNFLSESSHTWGSCTASLLNLLLSRQVSVAESHFFFVRFQLVRCAMHL